jgi:hypothetical protein
VPTPAASNIRHVESLNDIVEQMTGELVYPVLAFDLSHADVGGCDSEGAISTC